jgi:hypothetical protein
MHPIGPGEEINAMVPSIEAFFQTLGLEGNKLTLKLELMQYFFTRGYGTYGEELSEAVERARGMFTGGRVEVVWKGFVLKEELSRTQERMREKGWEMVDWGMHPTRGGGEHLGSV